MARIIADDQETVTLQTASGSFTYSRTRMDALGASEYTLVAIVQDVSGSVAGFRPQMEKAIQEIVKSCEHSPRRDNLLVAVLKFDSNVMELHGFIQLDSTKNQTYTLQPGGNTALYDATLRGLKMMTDTGAYLISNDYSVNGVIFVITDGDDNASSASPAAVQAAFAEAIRSENLESLLSVLIGVNVSNGQISRYLSDYQTKAGFTQYVEIQNATERELAKLAAFVSQSISSQSQSLGTGGASQPLTF
jgi:uncharacterized protein YegL